MYCTRKVSGDFYWVGASDRRISKFENMFRVPNGVSYNSYLLMGEKTVLLDTVDAAVEERFFNNLGGILQERTLDYIIVNHMEPDHSAGIRRLMEKYPEVQVIGNQRTFQILGQFFPDAEIAEERKIVVKDEDVLEIAGHKFHFYLTPMVHWPESMMTFDENEGILFSQDAFGSFGAINGNLFQDEVEYKRMWKGEARRYYANIVGKYGAQVQAAMKKLADLDIKIICPLHGLVWRNGLDWFLKKYDKWSRYEPEEQSVLILYGSMYGNTETVADILACSLAEQGVKNIAVYDVSQTGISYIIAQVFRCSHIVFAAPTYNGDVYTPMKNIIEDMKALNVQNRTVALVENGSWGPVANSKMRTMLETLKDIRFLDPAVTIKSSLDETGREALQRLSSAILENIEK